MGVKRGLSFIYIEQRRLLGLRDVCTLSDTTTFFGAKAPSSACLKCKLVQAPVHRSGKCNG